MKTKVLKLLILMVMLPLLSMAQKAYETVSYKGELNRQKIRLNLANGYIGASAIIIRFNSKSIQFTPEMGSANADGRLRFNRLKNSDHPSTDYFILDNMADAYETLPLVIKGQYYHNGKKINIKFRTL